MSGDHDEQSYEVTQRPDAPLGTLVFRAGLVPADELESALEEGVRCGRRLSEILLERGLIQEDDLARLLAGQQDLPFVDPLASEPDPDAVRLLPEDEARLLRALPIGFAKGVPLVAVADPTDDLVTREVAAALGGEPQWAVASRSALAGAIEAAYARSGEPVAEPADGHIRSLEAISSPEVAETPATTSSAPAGARSGAAFQVTARLSNGERVEIAVAHDRPA